MMFENFDQVVSYMDSFTNLEKNTDLYNSRTYRTDRVRALLEHMDNPQNCYRKIHIAGTKGKGSTASFIAKGLKALGFKTGLYMSPHVSSYKERFTLCGEFVSDCDLIKTAQELSEYIDTFDQRPTTFEVYTVFAFLLFKNLHCDWAVIETGLGGRLDATNVIIPEASVITPIELEHTELLGNTIREIATEKSKIIKNNIPVFVSAQKEEAELILREEAKLNNSAFHSLKEEVKTVSCLNTPEYQKTQIIFSDNKKIDLQLKMIGKVQAENCALALMVLKSLNLYSEGITEKALEDNKIPGRMEKTAFSRPLFLDGAHTPNSIESVIKTFEEIYPDQKKICIFGCVAGKKSDIMCKQIIQSFDTILVCRPGTFKKSNPQAIYEQLNSLKKDNTVLLKEEALDALKWILDNTQEGTPVIACGSFYLAGVIKEALCLL